MPRSKARPLFELGGQWIASEPGRRALYRFWNDAGTGRTRRESLGTTDIEAAKRRLAEIVVRGAPKTKDALLAAVLLDYFEKRTDLLPSRKQSRNAGRVLLKCWGHGIRVSEITDAKQKAFVDWTVDQGHSLAYAARNLTVLKSALSNASIDAPAKIVTSESKMRSRWGVAPVSAPRAAYVPTDDELVRLLRCEMPDTMRRWIIISMLTVCRPSAALDVAPEAWRKDAGILYLNPPGRAQNKKHRPAVRAPRCLSRLMTIWERKGLDAFGGRYCGYTTYEGVKSAIERLRDKAGIPALTAYSFRHKGVSVLRAARVAEDEVAWQIGHRRQNMRITIDYGEWSPDYLKQAASALDAWFLALHRKMKSRRIPAKLRERSKKAA